MLARQAEGPMKCLLDKHRNPRSDPGIYVKKLVMVTPVIRGFLSQISEKSFLWFVSGLSGVSACLFFYPWKNLTTLMLKHPGVVTGAYSPGPEDAETDGSGTSPIHNQASENSSPDALP